MSQHALRRVLRGLVVLIPFVAQGIILPGESDGHLRRNGTASLGKGAPNEKENRSAKHHGRHLRRNVRTSRVVNASTKGFHRLDARNVANSSLQGQTLLEAAETPEVLEPNATDEPEVFARRLGTVLTLEGSTAMSQLASKSSTLGVLVILLCLVVMCAFIITELQSSEGSYTRAFPEYSRPQQLLGPPRVGVLQAPPRSKSPRFPAPSAGSLTPSGQGGPTGFEGHEAPPLSHSSNPSRRGSYSDIRNIIPNILAPFSSEKPAYVQRSMYQAKPTPICPELVLLVESWYAIQFESIDSAAGPVPIYGRGKKLLLTATIQKHAPGTGSVILTMGDALGPLLGSITSRRGGLAIQDKHGQPYGELTGVGHLAYSLTCGGVEAIRITTDSRTGRALLVNPYDGTHLASAAKLHEPAELPSSEDHLGIAVVAGMDPVLTILCVIGAMALTT